jgi:hypothetical protein
MKDIKRDTVGDIAADSKGSGKTLNMGFSSGADNDDDDEEDEGIIQLGEPDDEAEI